jgi:YD repeat-containing protein
VLPAGARKVSTSWHPVWRLAARTAQPRLRVTHVYNGQPDPFAGGAPAACAPFFTTLPHDSSPIAVLCKRVEQATTDADGAQGFGAALDASVPARVWRYTYDQYGQVLTETDPRGATTSHTYHPDTTTNVTRGDRASTTNAGGHVTQFTHYNRHGQLLRSVDANGVESLYTYDRRQRLLSASVGGQLMSYQYWPTGLLKKATLPDGSHVQLEYDAAQRLIAISDDQGHRIDYTLDAIGNRVGEQARDAGGTLRRTLARSVDALGRVQQTIGRE